MRDDLSRWIALAEALCLALLLAGAFAAEVRHKLKTLGDEIIKIVRWWRDFRRDLRRIRRNDD
jgi:hypothetical protein